MEFEKLRKIIVDTFADTAEFVHKYGITRAYAIGVMDGVRRFIEPLARSSEELEELTNLITGFFSSFFNGTSEELYKTIPRDELWEERCA